MAERPCGDCGKPVNTKPGSTHVPHCLACLRKINAAKRDARASVMCCGCGEDFSSNDYRQIYCSGACYQKHKGRRVLTDQEREQKRAPKIRTCRGCGEDFTTTDGRRVWCLECRGSADHNQAEKRAELDRKRAERAEKRAERERKRAEKRAERERKRAENPLSNCQTCGKEFIAHSNKLYCSEYCRPWSTYRGEMSEEQAKKLLNAIVLNYFAGGSARAAEIIMNDLATRSSSNPPTIGELIGTGRKPFWPRNRSYSAGR